MNIVKHPRIQKYLLTFIAIISLISCRHNDSIGITETYFNDYGKKEFSHISSMLSDSIFIVEEDLELQFSLADFNTHYQWDSVFLPVIDIMEISSIDKIVFVTVSIQSKRFEFLENSPMITKRKISFKENKIHTIEILENVSADFNVWTNKRDSLVEWTHLNHPELDGFIYDLTKTGGENYLKAIGFYSQRDL